MNKQTAAMRKMIHITKAHHCVIESGMKDMGLHRSMHIMLYHIAKCDAPPSQKDLAQMLNISPAAVAATVERLESEGYIEKTVLNTDRRTNLISISEKGRSALDQVSGILGSTDEEIFAGLGEDEIDAFIKTLDTIIGNIKAIKENKKEDNE